MKRIFDATPVPMVLSYSDGSFEYVNRAMLSLLGYTSDEIYDTNLIISHPDNIEVNQCIRERLRQNPFDTVVIEKKYLHKSGRTIEGLLTLAAEADEEGNIKRMIAQVVDLTEHKKTAASLLMFKTLLDSSNDAIYVIDSHSSYIIECNQLGVEYLANKKEEVIHKLKVSDLNPKMAGDGAWPAFIDKIKKSKSIIFERTHTHIKGYDFPVEISISYIEFEEKTYVLAVMRDISQRKADEKLIWQQANYDHLTGLPNRRLLLDRLEQLIHRIHHTNSSLALFYLDLDRFKEVNDKFGHAKGDLLLQDVAKRLTQCVRKSDTVARLGGDEFTIIIAELEDEDKANKITVERIAQAILNALNRPFKLDNEQVYISASIGITFYPEDANFSDVLLNAADQAMYAAKKQGKNCFQYFSFSMQEEALSRLQLVKELHLAIEKQEFHLVYQPIIALKTGLISKAEALIRWQHPTRGLVYPNEFIPTAEETGLICEIGDWVFKQVAQQVAKWRIKLDPNFQLNINTSPIEYLKSNAFLGNWVEYLNAYSVPGEALAIEITERILMDSHSFIPKKLVNFQSLGIDVALDDFGMGYSSLSYIKKFDIDFLKIDRSFVKNITTSVNDKIVCEAIVAMAHKLGIKVVAEGIETEAQRRCLKDIGCDYGQGFLFSVPLDSAAFEQKMIKEHLDAIPDYGHD
ncbi:EAL domain-containing protein [Marinomonas sp. MED121]|uniref:sensor domain-containing protein n=1 Tax=Marinomonas sp. MED121 TaxID=314277 RepID=UPI001A94BA32|nr:EAL domain-containing protein [Marinomonas sp. MED121]